MVVLILLAFFLIAVGWGGSRFWDAHFGHPRLPDETRLRQLFSAKRDLFEQVRSMTLADQAHYFGVSSNGSDDFGLPAERLQEYRTRLRSIGRDIDLWPRDGGNTIFSFEGAATLAIGPHWANGIEYIPGSPTRVGTIVKTVRGIDLNAEGEIYLLPLGDGWYIFHEDY